MQGVQWDVRGIYLYQVLYEGQENKCEIGFRGMCGLKMFISTCACANEGRRWPITASLEYVKYKCITKAFF